MLERSAGILLPLSSLPSPHGIGTMGKAAYDFADFLAAAGQKYWQLLPLGPTSYGDSPYQSFSSFAGDPYFIDLELLVEDGLLVREEVDTRDWGSDARRIDYGRLYENRFPLLAKAKARGYDRDREAVAAFEQENAGWLPNYTLFMALKRHFGMKPWTAWDDEDIRCRRSSAVIEHYRAELRKDVELFTYIQFLFFRQWATLKAYIHSLGIRIIGDLPIYVAMDSSDVWAEPEMFRLDAHGVPTEVAGVPPDYCTADGQLWGNPLYDWDRMRDDGYRWWIRRLGAAGKLYDTVRIDHFRGLESYWAVPYGETTARSGHWRKGPGESFIDAIKTALPGLDIIAEDLGFMTPEVIALREYSGFPGMKVLQFAFDSREPSDYLPHRYPTNCICYTGTHDNATLAQWLGDAKGDDVAYAKQYLGLNDEEGYVNGIIRGGMSSVADLFVAQMQDWLALGGESRMNVPGVLGHGNWCWRMLPGVLTDELADHIAAMTAMYSR